MEFEDWYDEDCHDLFNYPVEAMKEAWIKSRAVTVDEAVKIAEDEHTPNCDHAANKIKELKESRR